MTTAEVALPGARLMGPLRRSAVLFCWDLYEWGVLCWWLTVLCTCWAPWIVRATALVRCNVNRQRALASQYGGVVAPRAYHQDMVIHHDFVADARELRLHASDRTARGDLWWHLYNPVIGGTTALLPFALMVEAIWGLVLPFLWSRFHGPLDHPWVFGVPVAGQSMANVMALVSVLLIVPIMRWSGPWAVKVHCRWVGRILIAPRPENAAAGGDGNQRNPAGRTTCPPLATPPQVNTSPNTTKESNHGVRKQPRVHSSAT